MSKRRGHGEGSVYQRADGRWAAMLDLGREGGKRQRKALYGRTKTEVLRKLREAQRHAEAGTLVRNETGTVDAFLTQWLDGLDSVKASSKESYATVVRAYISPSIGGVRLAKLSPADVQRMLDDLAARGLSVRTRRYARAVLRRALGRAERWGMVSRNVAALVDGPTGPQKGGRTLTPEQARHLLAASRGHRLEPFVAVALACGLRRGEALGLRWGDVDLDDGVLEVKRTLSRVGGQLTFSDPKTKGSRRQVELPEAVKVALRAHRKRQLEARMTVGPAWQDLDLVFATAVGTPMDPDNVRRDFSTLTKSAGLGHWTPHELRHSAASLMLAQGVPVEVVSRVLGHASIRITVDTYAHLLRDQTKAAATAMDAMLGGHR